MVSSTFLSLGLFFGACGVFFVWWFFLVCISLFVFLLFVDAFIFLLVMGFSGLIWFLGLFLVYPLFSFCDFVFRWV